MQYSILDDDSGASKNRNRRFLWNNKSGSKIYSIHNISIDIDIIDNTYLQAAKI